MTIFIYFYFDKSCFYSVGFILHRKEEYTMRKLTKTEATTKGLKIKKLLDWIELEKKIKLMQLEAKMLREDSFVDAFMSLQNDEDIIIGNQIKLKNVISTRFNSTEFKKDNPKLYAKYQNQIVNSIKKDLI